MNSIEDPAIVETPKKVYSPELMELLTDIRQKRAAALTGQIRVSDQTNFYASTIGYPCERFIYHQLKNGADLRAHGIDTQIIFNEGNLHEKEVLMTLMGLGFKVVGLGDSRAYQLKNTIRKISMKFDAYIQRDKRMFPVEVKSCSTYYFDDVWSEDDIKNSDRVWVRAWYNQMNLYLFGSNQTEGLFVLKNRNNGKTREIPVSLDWDAADALIQKAERIDRAIADCTPPAQAEWSLGFCAGCRARPHLCAPDEIRKATTIWTDEEFISMLKRREYLKALVAEYNQIEKKLKVTCNGVDGVIAGDFIITGKMGHRDAEKKIRGAVDFWQKDIQYVGPDASEGVEG
jgi:hypothetical protein